MKSRELINRALFLLDGIDDASFSAHTLFSFCFGRDYRLFFEDISEESTSEYFKLVQRRAEGEPLQYIVGSWPFLGREFKVGPGVLIPRPETEEVVVRGLSCIESIEKPRVLDLCAGSGCIGISISLERPSASVICVEKYQDAFSFLKCNAHRLGSAAEAVLADALDYHRTLDGESLDLIISNPPYITEEAFSSLQAEVLREPKTALVADENGLYFYRRISKDYLKTLKPDGYLVFEIGYDQKETVTEIMRNSGYRNVVVFDDSFGNPRIAVGQK